MPLPLSNCCSFIPSRLTFHYFINRLMSQRAWAWLSFCQSGPKSSIHGSLSSGRGSGLVLSCPSLRLPSWAWACWVRGPESRRTSGHLRGPLKIIALWVLAAKPTRHVQGFPLAAVPLSVGSVWGTIQPAAQLLPCLSPHVSLSDPGPGPA